MASKICVPCDFGIQNMYDPFHGNVNIEFADETKIKVNSLILSWNSATFCYFFNELRLEGGVPMANYGELWRRFLWRIGPNSTAQFAIIRHNSPNFLQIYYRLGIFLLYRQAFLASIQVFNLCANAISR